MPSGSNIFLVQSCLVAVAGLLSLILGTSRHSDINKQDVLHGISGAIGSALSITLLYPLETIRTRLQVDTTLTPHTSFLLIYNISKNEGFRGLYKGWFSLVVALMSLNFVYFYFFHSLRRWVSERFEYFSKVVIDLIVGYMAGVIAVLFTGPLWLANTRLKLQGVNIGQADKGEQKSNSEQEQYTGIIQCLCKISKDEGILTLWNGTTTSILLATNPAINLGVYMMLKRHQIIIKVAESNNSDSLEPFVNALLSKFIATVITYPIQLLQTRHRAGINQKEDTKQSTRITNWLSLMLGMYRGLESKLLQTCLNSALMFVVYEKLVNFLTPLIVSKEETVEMA